MIDLLTHDITVLGTTPPSFLQYQAELRLGGYLQVCYSTPVSKAVTFADDTTHKTIIDSGASTCGTGRRDQLKNLRPTTCTIVAAFGDTAQPTEMGDLPPFQLKTVVIDQMKDTTLLSVSQTCQKDMVGIFTAVDCRFYDIASVLPYLSDISINCKERIRGVVEDGLYVQESS